MRVLGLLLVLFGALALGYQYFTYVTREEVDADGGQVVDRLHTLWVPPVVGGIVVVSGLLLVATDNRRAEA